jgi:hypothetical protein
VIVVSFWSNMLPIPMHRKTVGVLEVGRGTNSISLAATLREFQLSRDLLGCPPPLRTLRLTERYPPTA